MSLESIRCGKCRALLLKAAPGAIAAAIEIKCRRCGTLHVLRPPPAKPAQEPEPERPER